MKFLLSKLYFLLFAFFYLKSTCVLAQDNCVSYFSKSFMYSRAFQPKDFVINNNRILAVGDNVPYGYIHSIDFINHTNTHYIIAPKDYYSPINQTRAYSIVPTADNKYFVLGKEISNNKAFIGTVNIRAFDMRNSKEFFIGEDILDCQAIPTEDNGLLGVFLLNKNTHIQTVIIRFDKDLNIVWKKQNIDLNRSQYFNKMVIENNNIYLSYHLKVSNTAKVGVLKLNYTTGELVWDKQYELSTSANSAATISNILFKDNKFWLFGLKYIDKNNANGLKNIFYFEANADGDLLTSKEIKHQWPLANTIQSPIETTIDFAYPNGFIIGSNIKENGNDNKMALTHISETGQLNWSKYFFKLKQKHISVLKKYDVNYVLLGIDNYYKVPYADSYVDETKLVMIVDSLGNVSNTDVTECHNTPLPTDILNFNVSSQSINTSISNFDDNLPVNKFNQDYFVTYVESITNCERIINCEFKLKEEGNCTKDNIRNLYLQENECGGTIEWIFDKSKFEIISQTKDTLVVFPKVEFENETIKAKINVNCNFFEQEIIIENKTLAETLSVGPDKLVCNENFEYEIKAQPGFKSYLWNNNSTDQSIKVTTTGTFYVDVTDNCGTKASDTLHINLISGSTNFIIGKDSYCENEEVELKVEQNLNVQKWEVDGVEFGNAASIKLKAEKDFSVKVTALTNGGCELISTKNYIVNLTPKIDLGNDQTICYNDNVLLTWKNEGFTNFKWNSGESEAFITVSAPQNYIVNALYKNNCYSSDSINITNYPFIHEILGNDTSICSNSNFEIETIQNNYTSYNWSNGSTNQKSGPITQPGEYRVDIVDQNGCKGADTIVIKNIYQAPENFLNKIDSLCRNESIAIQSLKTYASYNWSTQEYSNKIEVQNSGKYYLTVIDENKCLGTDSIIIVQKSDCITGIYIPNAFSPNNDYKNDIFKPIINIGVIEYYHIQVYNRWGQSVFESKNPAIGWDGKFRNKDVPNGTYIYVLHLKIKDTQQKTFRGEIIVIR